MVDWAGFAQLRQQNQEQNNPLNKFAQGYQIGAAINAQRQQQQANEAKMKRQQEMEGDFTRIYENYSGNPAEQAKELGRLSFKYPEIADKLDKQAASLDEKVKQGLVNDILPAYNAILTGNKDVAMQQLRTRAEAYNNAGDKANYERFNNFANSLENSTDLSQQVMTGGMYLAGIMGTKDFMGAIEKIPKTAQEFANMPLEQRQTLAKTLQEEEKAKQEAYTTQQKPVELAIKQEELKKAPLETKLKEIEVITAPDKAALQLGLIRQQIATSRANMAQSYQSATESKVRTEKLNQAQQPSNGAIVDLGLPIPARLPWASMTDEKQKNILMGSVYKASEKELNKKVASVDKLKEAAQLADRFIYLNQQTPTGALSDKFGLTRGVASISNPDYAEMSAITAKLAPANRPENAGATSDYDAKQYERATIGVDKSGKANLNMAKALKARAVAAEEYQDYLQQYLTQNGTLADADRNWKEYANKNPILDPKKQGTFELNNKREGWESYFAKKSGITTAPSANDQSIESLQQAALAEIARRKGGK